MGRDTFIGSNKKGKSRFSHIQYMPKEELENGKKVRSKTANPCPSSGEFVRNGKRYMRIITQDLVRDILVPDQDTNCEPLLVSKDELLKASDDPKVIQNLKEKAWEERERKAEESKRRIEKMHQIQKKYITGTKLDELEEKARLRSKYLYERANELKKEQEDVIKMCNGLILSKKCQAIRDAQIEEKKLIEKEILEEELRLEKRMEDERLEALKKAEMEKMNLLEKKNKFFKELKDQIQYNEKERDMLAEIMAMESHLADQVSMQVRMEEAKLLKEKLEKRQQRKEEMIRVNEELKQLAELERMKQSMIDLRIQEFVRMKAEQEAKREEELIRAKKEKEKEIAQFRKGFEKFEQNRTLRDQILVLKLQDEAEQKWREREKEAAEKRARLNNALYSERDKQIEERRRCQALEIELRRTEREEMAKFYKQALEKEKLKEEKHRQDIENYRSTLLKQMSEKHEEKLKERKEQFQYASKKNKELEENERELKKLMQKKVEEMRKHRVPEKYIREIEQKLRLV